MPAFAIFGGNDRRDLLARGLELDDRSTFSSHEHVGVALRNLRV
jgi:hypothetical protein